MKQDIKFAVLPNLRKGGTEIYEIKEYVHCFFAHIFFFLYLFLFVWEGKKVSVGCLLLSAISYGINDTNLPSESPNIFPDDFLNTFCCANLKVISHRIHILKNVLFIWCEISFSFCSV